MKMNIKNKKKITASPSASKEKMITWLCGSVIGTTVIAIGTYYLFFKPSLKDAPPVKSDKKQIAGYLASDKFRQLSMNDKKTYVKQLSEGQPWQIMRAPDIPKEEQTKLRENVDPVFHEMEKERLNIFFKMSIEAQQKELEKIAEKMKQRRAAQQQNQAIPAGGGTPAASPQGQQPGGGGRNSPERQKARYETTDPVTRAQQVEFRKMMVEQMRKSSTPAAAPAR